MNYTLLEFFIDFFFISLPITSMVFLFLSFSLSSKKELFLSITSIIILINTFVYYILTFGGYGELTESTLICLILAISFLIYDRNTNALKVIMYSYLSVLIIMVSQAIIVIPLNIILGVSVERFSNDIPVKIFTIIFSTFFQFLVLLKLYLIKKVRTKK